MLLIMYQIFSSLLGLSFFGAVFPSLLLSPHFYGVTFFGTPNMKKRNKAGYVLINVLFFSGVSAWMFLKKVFL